MSFPWGWRGQSEESTEHRAWHGSEWPFRKHSRQPSSLFLHYFVLLSLRSDGSVIAFFVFPWTLKEGLFRWAHRGKQPWKNGPVSSARPPAARAQSCSLCRTPLLTGALSSDTAITCHHKVTSSCFFRYWLKIHHGRKACIILSFSSH